jgi:hypothetical protein
MRKLQLEFYIQDLEISSQFPFYQTNSAKQNNVFPDVQFEDDTKQHKLDSPVLSPLPYLPLKVNR